MRFLVLAAFAAASIACQKPLSSSQPSPEALAREVLAALERRDVDRLRTLALTESEFRDVVWAELPAARPERNLPLDYVWNDLRAKSEAGLHAVLAEHGGRTRTFVRIEFAGETTQYRTFLVRREAVVIARDADFGEQSLRLFGSMIERAAAFKIFSYLVD